MLNRSSGKKRL